MMTGWEYWVSGAGALIVLAVCTLLVLHPDYEDGFYRRIMLAVIAIAAFSRCYEVVMADGWVSRIGVMLWVALAGFFLDHCLRFLRKRHRCNNVWHPATVVGSGGKVRR